MSDVPLAEIAYRDIRLKLLNAEYPPGTMLSESELAAKLRMSRTPVRAAIARLEKDGYLETINKRGILVKGIDVRELHDLFDLMTALYVYALDVADRHRIEPDLPSLRHHLERLAEAHDHNRYRDYYEHGLLFMRTLLSGLNNACLLRTFDTYQDKVLFYVIGHRAQDGSSRPFTGKSLYADLYRLLSEGRFLDAKRAILESEWNIREKLARHGYADGLAVSGQR
ncbi:GntR family transcriptional regulator [Paenibacillus flagellatus]|uniref:HTH gntR-type domain-containing protein n=1 Tax=Paenibacillus flagellatus TaxID=2211139 RepID=A0A2V5JW27_9BACL|nr:GntR family transcriptional regulator [Paenibacillus flagellatus]PYI50868.1 hypothetical protein DLM86_27765 [Paenibacillus flagellatus]